MIGCTVVNWETTGLAYDSHVQTCEVAMVLVGRDGPREGICTTVANPRRDSSRQHLQGISARDVLLAPTLYQIAGDLASLLAGRVFVANNLTFDASFLIAEFTRAGWPLSLARVETLHAMGCTAQHGGRRSAASATATSAAPWTTSTGTWPMRAPQACSLVRPRSRLGGLSGISGRPSARHFGTPGRG